MTLENVFQSKFILFYNFSLKNHVHIKINKYLSRLRIHIKHTLHTKQTIFKHTHTHVLLPTDILKIEEEKRIKGVMIRRYLTLSTI